MAILGLKEMGKFLWERREKSLPSWLSHFSFAELTANGPFSLPYQRNFPISFKPTVAIAEFFWKMQRKTWYIFYFGGGRHSSFPQKPVVKSWHGKKIGSTTAFII